MKLNFWQRHSTCKECGVHFEPVTGYEARWGNLCATHRKPARELDEKRDAVIAWASANWPRLVEQMNKERSELEASYNSARQIAFFNLQAAAGNLAAQQSSFYPGGMCASAFGPLGL